jgi:hypothetical protein
MKRKRYSQAQIVAMLKGLGTPHHSTAFGQ